MRSMIGLGIGLSLGGGLVYMLATDPTFRLVTLVIIAFLLGIGLCIVLVMVIGNQTSRNQRSVLEAITPGSVNNKMVLPSQPYPQYPTQTPPPAYYFQQQLPGQLNPPIVDSDSELIG